MDVLVYGAERALVTKVNECIVDALITEVQNRFHHTLTMTQCVDNKAGQEANAHYLRGEKVHKGDWLGTNMLAEDLSKALNIALDNHCPRAERGTYVSLLRQPYGKSPGLTLYVLARCEERVYLAFSASFKSVSESETPC